MDTYEKKYNEALAWMRELYPGLHGATKEDAEHYFPELRESESEIHRKWILEYLYDGLRKADEQFKDHFKSAIEWLEKQKEISMPNSTELIEMWDNEKKMLEEKDFRGDEWRLAYNAFLDGFAQGIMVKQKEQKELPLMDGDADLYFDEWNQQKQNPTKRQCFEEGMRYAQRLQKEQKPKNILTDDDSLQTAYLKGQTDVLEDPEAYGLQKEQKPEWSNEDYRLVGLIQHLRDYQKTIDRSSNNLAYESVEEYIEWIKSHRYQPKQEWSEDDEDKMGVIIRLVEQNSGWPDRAIKEYVNWLKSIHPVKQEWSEEGKTIIEGACNALEIHGHTKLASMLKSLRPSWKPSEEHLSALLAVFNDPDNIGSQTCQLALTDLYEQLKKL